MRLAGPMSETRHLMYEKVLKSDNRIADYSYEDGEKQLSVP